MEYILFLSKFQLLSLKIIPLFYCNYTYREIDRMIDKDIEAYISRDRYVDR